MCENCYTAQCDKSTISLKDYARHVSELPKGIRAACFRVALATVKERGIDGFNRRKFAEDCGLKESPNLPNLPLTIT